MRIEILPTAAEVAERGADLVAEAVRGNPRIVLALPTGRTPIEMYARLARRRRDGKFDLSLATAFNLDEVLLPRTVPQTFFQFMTRHAWEPLGVAPGRRFIPDGEAADPEAECLRYETAIAAAGGIELALLGVGADGHIAYNLPDQVKPRTHVVTLDPDTLKTLGGDIPGPVRAITMGIETIASARRLVLLATGASKAEALRRLKGGPAGSHWPCTLLSGHPDLTVVADATAAAQL